MKDIKISLNAGRDTVDLRCKEILHENGFVKLLGCDKEIDRWISQTEISLIEIKEVEDD